MNFLRPLPASSAFVLSLVIGCSSSSEKTADPGIDTDAGAEVGLNEVPEWDKPVTAPESAEAATKRESCGYAKGAMPAETHGKALPMGKSIPVDTIVIVMMENRSFDHYFQKLKENGQPDVDVAPADFANPGPDGKPIAIHHDQQLCFVDTNHEWEGVHDQVGEGGLMQGFAKTNDGFNELPAHGTPDMLSGARAMTYYEKSDLPFMYWAADNFSIADRYFCALQGPTWPNRMFLYAATSFGRTSNKFADGVDVVLMDNLEKRGVTWKVYSSLTPGMGVFADRAVTYRDHIVDGSVYFEDAAAGTLPQVAFVDPKLGGEGYGQNDEHPPAMMQVGQQWVASVTKALIQSPQWSRSAMFLTYDEHGGLYDHVTPPKACAPDGRPTLPPGSADQKFDQYGVRVPFVTISPFAKKHHVSHQVMSHTSITRFVEARFTLPAMTARDANAEVPFDMFDFTTPPNASPSLPPEVKIDDKVYAACKAAYEK